MIRRKVVRRKIVGTFCDSYVDRRTIESCFVKAGVKLAARKPGLKNIAGMSFHFYASSVSPHMPLMSW